MFPVYRQTSSFFSGQCQGIGISVAAHFRLRPYCYRPERLINDYSFPFSANYNFINEANRGGGHVII